jgi:hypothetical protein
LYVNVKQDYTAAGAFSHSMKVLRTLTWEAARRHKMKNLNIAVHACDVGEIFEPCDGLNHSLNSIASANKVISAAKTLSSQKYHHKLLILFL